MTMSTTYQFSRKRAPHINGQINGHRQAGGNPAIIKGLQTAYQVAKVIKPATRIDEALDKFVSPSAKKKLHKITHKIMVVGKHFGLGAGDVHIIATPSNGKAVVLKPKPHPRIVKRK